MQNKTEKKLAFKPIQDVYLSRVFCLHLTDNAIFVFEFIQNVFLYII